MKSESLVIILATTIAILARSLSSVVIVSASARHVGILCAEGFKAIHPSADQGPYDHCIPDDGRAPIFPGQP